MLQYLDVRIRRTHVLQDALNQLMYRPDDLKKPLRVTFISAGVEEEGLDEGGVTKEFFQLLIREIFNEVTGHVQDCVLGCYPTPSAPHQSVWCVRAHVRVRVLKTLLFCS